MDTFLGKNYNDGVGDFVPTERLHYKFNYHGVPRSAIKTEKGPIWPKGVPMGAIPAGIRRALGVSEEDILQQNKDIKREPKSIEVAEKKEFQDYEREIMRYTYDKIMRVLGETDLSKKGQIAILEFCISKVNGVRNTEELLHKRFFGTER